MRFSKYHGCGNDFIIVAKKDLDETVETNSTDGISAAYSGTAKAVCDRHKGIGADGLIIVGLDPVPDKLSGNQAPVEMIIYNSDGSLAPMCGNGIRCFANYCSDEGIVSDDIYPIQTGAGIMEVAVISRDPFDVEIVMGKPDYDAKVSSIDTDLPEFIDQQIPLTAEISRSRIDTIKVSTFFIGTIHTVIWVEDFDNIAGNAKDEGKIISEAPVFKEKTNVNFVEIIDRDNIKVWTYERGAGYTQACGTGACASVTLGIREGRLNNKVNVILPGGELTIRQNEDEIIFMQGPSRKIADGRYIV